MIMRNFSRDRTEHSRYKESKEPAKTFAGGTATSMQTIVSRFDVDFFPNFTSTILITPPQSFKKCNVILL